MPRWPNELRQQSACNRVCPARNLGSLLTQRSMIDGQTTGDVIVEQLLQAGAWIPPSACPVMASTEFLKHCARTEKRSGSSSAATRRPPLSPPADTPSSPAGWASASRPAGPGRFIFLNGLYDAKLDHAPVLAITGHTYHDQIGTFFQQEIDILTLFNDVASYNHMILGANHARTSGRSGLPVGACRRGASRT